MPFILNFKLFIILQGCFISSFVVKVVNFCLSFVHYFLYLFHFNLNSCFQTHFYYHKFIIPKFTLNFLDFFSFFQFVHNFPPTQDHNLVQNKGSIFSFFFNFNFLNGFLKFIKIIACFPFPFLIIIVSIIESVYSIIFQLNILNMYLLQPKHFH
jgi:hypothetical protein